MGVRAKRIKQHKEWTKTIDEYKDQYGMRIIRRSNQFISQAKKIEDKEKISIELYQLREDVRELIWDSLEQSYSLCNKMIKDIYNISSTTIQIEDLTYDGDGKSLDERITDYFEDILKYIKNSEHPDWDKIKRNLHHRLILILDTETQTLKTKITYRKVEAHCEFGEVLPGECCPGSGGIYPIDELDLPPFHPGCLCEAIFYEELTDDEQEIEDLELEVEKVYL